MLCVVAPVLQTLPVASDEVNTTLPPWQKVVGPPAVMVTPTQPLSIVTDFVAVHPLASDMVQV